mmetsp:Transcript_70932/g.147826  ORF Transcript_70932/g.147826 Transcript_70932/m.147826 type:complete len:108 (+) Transcript_70932:317-640(+)
MKTNSNPVPCRTIPDTVSCVLEPLRERLGEQVSDHIPVTNLNNTRQKRLNWKLATIRLTKAFDRSFTCQRDHCERQTMQKTLCNHDIIQTIHASKAHMQRGGGGVSS